MRTTEEILDRIRQRVERHQVSDAAELKGLIREHLLEILQASERAPAARDGAARGGAGGRRERLGQDHHDRQAGARASRTSSRSVLLCAADTFRAAAIEQLEIWGERTNAAVIRQKPGQRSERRALRRAAMRRARARSTTSSWTPPAACRRKRT